MNNAAFNIRKTDCWIQTILPAIMEYGIYLLAIFLFTGKGETFRSIGLYLPPIALVAMAHIKKGWDIDWKNPLFLITILFCLSAILSSLLSPEIGASLHFFKRTYVKLFLIFLVVATAFDSFSSMRRLLTLFAALALFFTVLTYYDYVTKALTGNGTVIYNNVRAYNCILAYLLPFIPYKLLTSRTKQEKILWVVGLSAGIPALLLTGFRGGWVSMFVSIVIWGVWLVSRRGYRPLLFILAGTVILTSFVLTTLPAPQITKRIHQGISTTGRYEWHWKAYARIFNDAPLIRKIAGWGLTKKIMIKKYKEWYKAKTGKYPPKNYPLNPHDHFLTLLFKQGIIGLFLYLCLIFVFAGSMVRAINNKDISSAQKAMGIAILCPFIGEYVVHALVEDMRFMPLGFLLGMAGGYLESIKRGAHDNNACAPL